MSNKAFILCVDDEPINITIMEELLSENYRIECVASGKACLEVIQQRRPDLILLDVNMPGMDGLETCVAIRENFVTREIPVVFVSALATESELMAGYEAGGDDYITKPFSDEILQRKIEIVLESEKKKLQLLETTDSALQALTRSQSNMGELDLVMSFTHDCFQQIEYHGLAKVIFDCLSRLKLDSSLIFMVDPEPLYWFSDDIDRPMERQILLNLNGQDRIVKFGARMAINCSTATILIRNMPEELAEASRLTDHLSIIIECLDAKIACMKIEDDMRRHRQAIDQSIAHSRKQLESVKAFYKKQRVKGDRQLSNLSSNIDQLAEKKGYDDSQKNDLHHLMNRFSGKSGVLNDERQIMNERIETLISEIIDTLNDR